MYKEKIVNIETNTETWRDYTEEEIVQVENSQLEATKNAEDELKAIQAKNVLLAKLGITEEEAKLLLS